MSVGDVDVRGVLKAPVDCCWRRSKISCSSFGRRGGDGEGVQLDCAAVVALKGRRKKPGRMERSMRVAGCMVVMVNPLIIVS